MEGVSAYLGHACPHPKQNEPQKDTHFFWVPRCRPFKPLPIFSTYDGQTPSAANLLTWVSASSRVCCGTTLTAKTQSTSSENFPLEWQTNVSVEGCQAHQKSANGGKLAFFSLEFWPKNLSAAENQNFFADATGLTGLVLSILSVLSPSDSTNYKQFLLWGESCCTPAFCPPSSPGGFCHFEVRGVVFWPWVSWCFPKLSGSGLDLTLLTNVFGLG